ncbi:MAG: polynucleotidyl transferase [Pseudomonadota bacterium]
MNILALDPANKMGWALLSAGKITHGTANLTPKPNEQSGQRWFSFRRFLTESGTSAGELHAIYYEESVNKFAASAEIFGGFLAHLQHWCMLNNIPCHPVHWGTIKKHWAGTGRADKDMMIFEAKKRGFAPGDNNAADALAVLSTAMHQELIDLPFARPAVEVKMKTDKKTAKLPF